jgi:hypothetical protein
LQALVGGRHNSDMRLEFTSLHPSDLHRNRRPVINYSSPPRYSAERADGGAMPHDSNDDSLILSSLAQHAEKWDYDDHDDNLH